MSTIIDALNDKDTSESIVISSPPYTIALLVLASADVAKLVATAASHMITTVILLHPKVARRALFGSDLPRPINQLLIDWQELVIDFISLGLNRRNSFLLLNFFTCLRYMVDHVAFEAILDATHGAAEVSLVVVIRFTDEKVFAFLRWTLAHVCILIANLFPFELLTSFHLFRRQKLSKIRQRNRLLAARFGTQDRQLLIFDACLDPRCDAGRMKDVCTNAEGQHLTPILSKQRHLADFADILLLFALLTLLYLFKLSEELLLHILWSFLLHFSFLFLS